MANIKIQLNGETYEVREKALRNYNGKVKIYGGPTEAGQLVKQFVKKNFPQYLCRVKADSFANGNSLDVYVTTPNGGSIPKGDFDKINSFAHQFEYGKFDAMYDIYESYENSGTVTDKGTEIEAAVKYVHVNNRPRFGTVEAILNEVINEGREFAEVVKYYTDSTGRPAAAKAKLMLDKLTK
jgi:hypothetical protein